MAAAHGLDDEAGVAEARHRPDEAPVVADGEGQEGDAVRRVFRRHVEPAEGGFEDDAGNVLGEQADRARGGGAEGGRALGVGLFGVPGGVDLVVHHDEGAQAPRRPARGDRDGREQVRGTVRPGDGRVAHRAGDDDRRVPSQEEVEGEGRLLDGVGALGDDHAGRAVLDGARRFFGDLHQVLYLQLGARDLEEGAGGNLRDPGELGDGPDEPLAGQRGLDARAARVDGRDGAAQRKDKDFRKRHGAPDGGGLWISGV